MTNEKKFDIAGYAGIAFIQSATLPSLLNRLITGEGALPPLSMTLMLAVGLALFLARSVYRKDMVAIVSNTIGFILQSVLLAMLLLPVF